MSRKYIYQGMPLSEYCRKNNIPRNPIYIRIKRLKAKYSNLTDTELVSLAIQKEIMPKHKHMYQGIPLKKYCDQNNIPVKKIYNRLTNLRKKYPNFTDSELLKLAIEGKHFSKYIYKDQPLKEYCNQNGISYSTISKHIRKLKIDSPNLLIEEIITKVLEEYTNSFNKNNSLSSKKNTLLYKGLSLKAFCANKGIPYSTIYQKIEELKLDYPNLSSDELVNKALKTYYNPSYNINRFFYLGTSLKIFCLKNNISYEDTLNYLYSFLDKEENYAYVNELVAYSVERNFLINGITLKDYCLTNNLSYEEIHKLLEHEQKIHYDTKFRTILDNVIYRINELKFKISKNNVNTLTLIR